MPIVPATHRSLGLTVPVTEVLDPTLWRERYVFGTTLGPGVAPSSGAAAVVAACSGSRRRAQLTTQQETALGDHAGEIPDDVIRWHLRAALSELEVKLGIPMGTVVVKGEPVDAGLIIGQHYDKAEPRRQFQRSAQRDWLRLDLPPSVISVERIRAYWFGTLIWEISQAVGNLEIVQISYPTVGTTHLVPTSNTMLTFGFPLAGSVPWQAIQQVYGWPAEIPAVWSCDYTIGPVTHTGEVGRIEAVLAHWVYCKAGIVLLSIGGMATSRGLTSASLSIDGISKSFGLQASAMYGVNSALETRLKEAEEAIDWKALKTYKAGIRVMPYA